MNYVLEAGRNSRDSKETEIKDCSRVCSQVNLGGAASSQEDKA